ncbi:Uma2 family endonuclease [Streptomyces tubbatahanensis]|uniref:Uma2 family endonuclease n=1 Tax=Streptomyces tubbatahanensis TaxID=2923272 RepID=A0ABY3XT40_9ACTN|nr:Uma2 family endonuclease [Streptomyces tubbatahanensis]UNS97617.1 Uma2 family endonuclease [Streptomyces tubbatahanensis]
MAAEAPARATDWEFMSEEGWTFDQAQELDLPFDWELVDGMIVVRGRAMLWHNQVRDELRDALKQARTMPLKVVTESCVMLDKENVRQPDVIVYDPTGLNLFETECVPISNVTLAIEVVSPGSRSQDRVLKPAQYAAAKVPYYWRVELERDNQLAVHEYWLNADTRSYIPRPERPVHRRELTTDLPFPLKIDLAEFLGF